MLKVTFVHHSCFVVETNEHVLVFDYFPKEAVLEHAFSGKMPPLPKDKQIVVLSSHRHRDHFTMEIFHWLEEYPQIIYVLSKDIRLGKREFAEAGLSPDIKKRITFVSPLNEYEVENLKIKTLRSTDEGVAFLVDVDGLCLYHAGDLHWWNWGERGEIYCEAIGSAYKREVRRIGEKHVDVAFVVLDPRMGDEGYFLGMEYFLKNVSCDLVFPMHTWRDFDLIQKFKKRPQIVHFKDKIIDIDRENLIFEIED